eukprot:scaffold30437_cov31-Tisochrysis_lutea.AAC.3
MSRRALGGAIRDAEGEEGGRHSMCQLVGGRRALQLGGPCPQPRPHLHEEEPVIFQHVEDGAQEELEVGKANMLSHLNGRDGVKGL